MTYLLRSYLLHDTYFQHYLKTDVSFFIRIHTRTHSFYVPFLPYLISFICLVLHLGNRDSLAHAKKETYQLSSTVGSSNAH